MTIELRNKAINYVKKYFFKLMKNSVFGKTMENVKKNHKDIKLLPTKARTNYLVSKPVYYATKFFTKNLLAIEMKKVQIFLNKPLYLGLSILDLSKTVKYEFWYDYVKLKYGKKAILYYMETEHFIV